MNEVMELTETQRETTKEIKVLSETREIDRVENELNKTKEETETKIQEETNKHEETTEEFTETQREMQELKEITETREIEETEGELDETRGGALGRVQNLRRQYCWVTQVNLISYSLNVNSADSYSSFLQHFFWGGGVKRPREPLW